MFKYLRRKTVSFALVAGTMGCLVLGALLVALASRQRGEFEWATWWIRAALVIFVLLVLYALPKLVQLINLEALPFQLPFHVPGIGVAFGTFVCVVALTAFSTGNNLLYLIFSLLLAMLMVSTIAARLNLTKLDLDLNPPKHIFAGEAAALEITFTNRKKILPSFSLTVALKGTEPKAEPHELTFFAIIPPRAQARARVIHTFAKRGVYALQNLTVITRFPFGLVERNYSLDSSGEMVVYPPARPLREFEQNLPLSLGQLESVRKGSGSDLYAIRQYQPTDHRHAIDWKATAKTSRLMVREFTREDDWRVTVHFAVQATAAESERFERAISLTASLLDHFIAEGAEVRLLIGTVDYGYGSSRAHWYALLRELARLQTTGEEVEQSVARPAVVPADHLWPAAGGEFTILLTSASPAPVPSGLRHSTHVIRFAEL